MVEAHFCDVSEEIGADFYDMKMMTAYDVKDALNTSVGLPYLILRDYGHAPLVRRGEPFWSTRMMAEAKAFPASNTLTS